MTTERAELIAEIKENSYASFDHGCIDKDHGDCTTTTYFVATIMTYGSDKSHRLSHTLHNYDDTLYFDNSPGCGSKRWGSPTSFRMTGEKPTCGRC